MANTVNDTTPDGSRENQRVFYSPGTIRTYVVALQHMFNDITVRRYAEDFITVVKEIPVPLGYGIGEKEFYERTEDYQAEGGQRAYQTVPRMSMVLNGINYAQDRVESANEMRDMYAGFVTPDAVDVFRDMQPVPFDYQFDITVRTESMEDLQQILEQILPYFNPNRTIRVKEIPFLNYERPLTVTIDSSALNIPTELSGQDMRVLETTFSITIRGYMYRPVTSVAVLKKIYRYLAFQENQWVMIGDRRVVTLVAETEAEIPVDAINRQQRAGYWIYQVVDDTTGPEPT